jgi:hypothetical protein
LTQAIRSLQGVAHRVWNWGGGGVLHVSNQASMPYSTSRIAGRGPAMCTCAPLQAPPVAVDGRELGGKNSLLGTPVHRQQVEVADHRRPDRQQRDARRPATRGPETMAATPISKHGSVNGRSWQRVHCRSVGFRDRLVAAQEVDEDGGVPEGPALGRLDADHRRTAAPLGRVRA